MKIKNYLNYLRNPRAFLLENRQVGQTIFKNTFWLTLAEGVTRFLKLILIIFVARILGATEYGKFTFALAFVSLFIVFSDFGLSQILTREFSKDNTKEKQFSSLLSLKIFLSLLALSLMIGLSFLITLDVTTRKVIWLLSLMVISHSFGEILFAFLRARQKMQYEAWLRISEALLLTGLGFLVLFASPSLINLSFSYLIAAFFVLLLTVIFVHKRIFPLSLDFNAGVWKNFLQLSWPLAFVGIFAAIYNQIDSVMMGYWKQITQTGWYNAASRIIGVAFISASLIGTSFFPALNRFFKESKEMLQKTWDYFMQLMIFLAIPLVVGGITLAPKIIDFVYDASFFPSVFAFQILTLMAGISFISIPFRQILVVFNQQKKLFWITLGGAGINVVLNLILIPKYSLYGAATATVITVCLIFFLLSKFALKFTSIKPLNFKFFLTFLSSILASALMYFVISQPQIYHSNIFISIFSGALVYFLGLFLLKILARRIFWPLN